MSIKSRVTSDHCPILLDSNVKKLGPVPFKFENMWLEYHDFKGKLKEWWEGERQQGWEGSKFMKKLRAVKDKVKAWNKESSRDIESDSKEAEERIKDLDLLEEGDQLSQDGRHERGTVEAKI